MSAMRGLERVARDRRQLIASQVRCSTGFTQGRLVDGEAKLLALSPITAREAQRLGEGHERMHAAARRLAKAVQAPVLALALLAVPAQAAPPAVGSEDWEVMAPFADWIRGLQHEGILCCTMADGRPVQARTRGEGWQVKWRPGQLDGAPIDWTDVPARVVLRVPNPTGMPLAFWLHGQIRCFVPPGAI